jgi:hypothetical protein
MRSRIAGAIEEGRLPEQARAAIADPEPETAEETQAPEEGAEQDQQEDRSVAADDQPGGDSSREAGEQEERVVNELADLKTHVRVEVELAKRRLLEADRK